MTELFRLLEMISCPENQNTENPGKHSFRASGLISWWTEEWIRSPHLGHGQGSHTLNKRPRKGVVLARGLRAPKPRQEGATSGVPLGHTLGQRTESYFCGIQQAPSHPIGTLHCSAGGTWRWIITAASNKSPETSGRTFASFLFMVFPKHQVLSLTGNEKYGNEKIQKGDLQVVKGR